MPSRSTMYGLVALHQHGVGADLYEMQLVEGYLEQLRDEVDLKQVKEFLKPDKRSCCLVFVSVPAHFLGKSYVARHSSFKQRHLISKG